MNSERALAFLVLMGHELLVAATLTGDGDITPEAWKRHERIAEVLNSNASMLEDAINMLIKTPEGTNQ